MIYKPVEPDYLMYGNVLAAILCSVPVFWIVGNLVKIFSTPMLFSIALGLAVLVTVFYEVKKRVST